MHSGEKGVVPVSLKPTLAQVVDVLNLSQLASVTGGQWGMIQDGGSLCGMNWTQRGYLQVTSPVGSC